MRWRKQTESFWLRKTTKLPTKWRCALYQWKMSKTPLLWPTQFPTYLTYLSFFCLCDPLEGCQKRGKSHLSEATLIRSLHLVPCAIINSVHHSWICFWKDYLQKCSLLQLRYWKHPRLLLSLQWCTRHFWKDSPHRAGTNNPLASTNSAMNELAGNPLMKYVVFDNLAYSLVELSFCSQQKWYHVFFK